MNIFRRVSMLFSLIFSVCTVAEQKARIELGVISGGQYLADYRGSDEMNIRALATPIFLYHGDTIQVDRSGVSGEVFKNRYWELNLSVEASLSGGNKENKARQGMPELKTALEFGPSLNVNVTGPSFSEGWLLRLPVRSVLGVATSGVDHLGYVFNPKMTFIKPLVFDRYRLSANVGAFYGSKKYHNYYYEVTDVFATSERPLYSAEGGYSGAYFKLSLNRRNKTTWYGFNVRYDNLSNTSFADSPLVKTNDYVSITAGVAWFFWNSN